MAGLGLSVLVGAEMVFNGAELVLALVTLSLFALLVYKPSWGAYLLVVAIPLVSAVPRGQIVPLMRLNEVLLLVVFLAVVVRLRGRLDRMIRFQTVDAGFLILLLTNSVLPFVALWFRAAPASVETILPVFASIQYYLLYLVLVNSIRQPVQIRRALWFFLAVGVLVAVIGLVQAMDFQGFQRIQDMVFLNYRTDLAVRSLRITSTFGGWNDLGSYLGLTLLVIFTLILERSLFSPVYLGAAAIVCFAALILSGNWSTTVSILIGSGIIFLLSGRRVRVKHAALVGVLLLVILCLVLLIPETQRILLVRLRTQFASGALVPSTIASRLVLWNQILDYLWLNPSFLLLGAGPSPAYIIATATQTHPLLEFWKSTFVRVGTATEESFYFMLLIRFGVIALAGYAAFLVIVARWLWRVLAGGGLARSLALMALGCLITLCIASITNAYFSYSGTSEVLWILLALVTAAREHERRRAQAAVRLRDESTL